MRRKLVKQGGSALTVSLPSKWAKSLGLSSGDEVEVEESEANLIISSQGTRSGKKEIDIVLEIDDRIHVRSILGALYRKGYDIIRVKYGSKPIFRVIQDSTNYMIGFEIMDHKPGFCVINNIITESVEEFDNALNKMINTCKTVQDILKEDYTKGEYDRLEEMEDYRFSGWKLRDYAMRLLNKNITLRENRESFYIIIWSVEKIIKEYKRTYERFKRNNSKNNKEVLELIDDLNDYFIYFSKSIHSKDLKRVEYINVHQNKLLDKGDKLIAKNKEDNQAVHVLMGIVKRVQDMSSSIVMLNY